MSQFWRRCHRSLAEAARGLTEASPKPHRSRTRSRRGLQETSESPSEYSEGLSENPESPSRFDTSEEKKTFMYLRTYVCHYPRILLALDASGSAFLAADKSAKSYSGRTFLGGRRLFKLLVYTPHAQILHKTVGVYINCTTGIEPGLWGVLTPPRF